MVGVRAMRWEKEQINAWSFRVDQFELLELIDSGQPPLQAMSSFALVCHVFRFYPVGSRCIEDPATPG